MKPGFKFHSKGGQKGIITIADAGSDATYGLDQGADPVLGPPYAPVVYQLYMGGRIQYGSVFKTHLYWTVPSLTEMLIGVYHGTPVTSPAFRVWFSDTSSPVVGKFVTVNQTLDALYFYPSAFVWAQTVASLTAPAVVPVGGGTAVPAGNQYVFVDDGPVISFQAIPD